MPRSAGLRSRHAGSEQRHPVEDQLAETGVILGQIVDLRLDPRLGRTDVFRRAVEIRRALDLEGKINRRETRIDLVRRIRIVGPRTNDNV